MPQAFAEEQTEPAREGPPAGSQPADGLAESAGAGWRVVRSGPGCEISQG